MCDERSPSANLERRSTDDAALKIEDEVARDVGCDARKESGALVGAQEVAQLHKRMHVTLGAVRIEGSMIGSSGS